MIKVLFVCIGNSCRSQMAEGFARAYGSDVLIAASAGTGPAISVSRDTIRVMNEKNIDVSAHFPKALSHLGRSRFDLVINMSGQKLPDTLPPTRSWDVVDPIGEPIETFRTVRDEIEGRVMRLIIELRRENSAARV